MKMSTTADFVRGVNELCSKHRQKRVASDLRSSSSVIRILVYHAYIYAYFEVLVLALVSREPWLKAQRSTTKLSLKTAKFITSTS